MMAGSLTVYILYNLLTLCLTFAQYDRDDPGPTAGECLEVILNIQTDYLYTTLYYTAVVLKCAMPVV